jgi:hypothetical protein
MVTLFAMTGEVEERRAREHLGPRFPRAAWAAIEKAIHVSFEERQAYAGEFARELTQGLSGWRSESRAAREHKSGGDGGEDAQIFNVRSLLSAADGTTVNKAEPGGLIEPPRGSVDEAGGGGNVTTTGTTSKGSSLGTLDGVVSGANPPARPPEQGKTTTAPAPDTRAIAPAKTKGKGAFAMVGVASFVAGGLVLRFCAPGAVAPAVQTAGAPAATASVPSPATLPPTTPPPTTAAPTTLTVAPTAAPSAPPSTASTSRPAPSNDAGRRVDVPAGALRDAGRHTGVPVRVHPKPDRTERPVEQAPDAGQQQLPGDPERPDSSETVTDAPKPSDEPQVVGGAPMSATTSAPATTDRAEADPAPATSE